MKVLVIGGTLFIGRSLVEELVKAGHDVAVLHRQPKHDFGRRVENMVADRNDAESVREALSGRRFEVVFDNVTVPARNLIGEPGAEHRETIASASAAAPRNDIYMVQASMVQNSFNMASAAGLVQSGSANCMSLPRSVLPLPLSPWHMAQST